MTHQEKRAWIMLVTAMVGYTAYVIIIASRGAGRPLSDVPYAAILLWVVGASIVSSIVAEIGIGLVNPQGGTGLNLAPMGPPLRIRWFCNPFNLNDARPWRRIASICY